MIPKSRFGRGKLPRRTPGVMNKLEAEYAQHLDLLLAAGEVLWWAFEQIKLRVSDTVASDGVRSSWSDFDFMVMRSDCTLELHDTKGAPVQDDSLVKAKVIADRFPFRVKFIRKKLKRDGGGWSETAFESSRWTDPLKEQST